jgi:4'-phosphopantetheinyl transferase
MPFLRMPTALRVREPSLALPSSEAHVWYAMTADCDKPDLRGYYLSVLSDEERARLEQFAFDHLKLEYLVTHALCRTVLSTYEDIPPSAWRFSFNAYGRPEIVRPYPSPRMRFSLTMHAVWPPASSLKKWTQESTVRSLTVRVKSSL